MTPSPGGGVLPIPCATGLSYVQGNGSHAESTVGWSGGSTEPKPDGAG